MYLSFIRHLHSSILSTFFLLPTYGVVRKVVNFLTNLYLCILGFNGDTLDLFRHKLSLLSLSLCPHIFVPEQNKMNFRTPL